MADKFYIRKVIFGITKIFSFGFFSHAGNKKLIFFLHT
nr:MAG TPA: hypothetical protein [Caudoviricetes sp.]